MTRAIRVPLKRYLTRFFKKDLLAGLTVGVISLPLAMAFAIASGANPENGIYTTIIAACLVALFGGSRYQVAGPTGAFIPILLSIVLTYGFDNLLIAGFLSGIILVIMGLLDMGSLIKFIPRSVTIGFTAGIAVNIFAGQISNFFGLTGLERHESFLLNMQEIMTHFDTINLYSTLTAFICLAVILTTPRFLPKVPGSLVGLILSTIIATLFFPNDVITIASAFGGIPSGLPHMQFPDITLDKIQLLLQPALTIAILGAIESLLSAVVADGLTGTHHNSNRELLGQGLANMVIPLFGGIPATGAIARTATNIKSGAATRYSVVISAVFVLLTMLALAPYAGLIPLASMAPVLMVVSYNMSQHQAFISIAKVKSLSTGVLLITFFLTVFANLTVAVEIGLLLTMMLFVKRMSEIMVVTQVVPDHENHLIDIADQNALHTYDCSQISIFSIEGPLFFGAAQMFSESIMSTIHYDPKIIILRMSRVPIMDITGENHLRMIVENIQKKGITVLMSGLNEQPEKKMKKTGLYAQVGQDHFFPHTNHAIAYALEHINKTHCSTCQKLNGNECVLDKK
ncbi:SulP family inorganic anion transporter [Pelosinus propionicus]|uniref:Sulfate permease, SulP family n=1 Tax=Pelosinus propionicus DSM 13327 TaxID=1123291 RepID=A0A1I4MHG4_9FIRM|nr:SulP family inorganic anion transporter [Pelosinus propionicus]SFM02699.1 sulfate permease, SulP family [Pelosinus propionicus DSM 13327]